MFYFTLNFPPSILFCFVRWNRQSSRTALFYAAQNGHIEAVQALLSRAGVEIDIEDKVHLFYRSFYMGVCVWVVDLLLFTHRLCFFSPSFIEQADSAHYHKGPGDCSATGELQN